MLAENTEGNLTPKQVKFAETIHSSGTDLLALINDILDLCKIESGKMDVEVGSVRFAELQDYCSAHLPPRGRRQGPRISRSKWRETLPAEIDHHRRQAAAAGAQESAVECAQVHRAWIGAAADRSGHQRAGARTIRC